MPAALTYPGVYIEEISSGVRTITGVSTSVTAFVGAAKRGPLGIATRTQSFADYERLFGGLEAGSEMSYAVRQFFLNGGTEAWIVRVAKGAVAALVELENDTADKVLRLTALDAGATGNDIHIEVDYATDNPGSTFNLTLTLVPKSGGESAVEVHRNLSLNDKDARYTEKLLKADSKLVKAERLALPAALAGRSGKSQSDDLSGTPDFTKLIDITHNTFRVAIDGKDPVNVVADAFAAPNTLASLVGAVNGKLPAGVSAAAVDGKFLVLTSGATGQFSSVRILPGETNDLAGRLKLGPLFGGLESDAAAYLRPKPVPPAATLVSDTITTADLNQIPSVKKSLRILLDGISSDITLEGSDLAGTLAVRLDDLRTRVEAKVRESRPANPAFKGFSVSVLGGNKLVLKSGTRGTGSSIEVRSLGVDALAGDLSLTPPDVDASLAKPADVTLGGGSEEPFNPTLAYNLFIGDRAKREGIFALEAVDLFNLLVLAGITDTGILMDAAAYCEERRAFLIADSPIIGNNQAAVADMERAVSGAVLPKSRNAAVFFPWVQIADPLNGGRLRTAAPAGTVAGLFARTDGTRGVWKAPAGTEATLVGVQALEYTLTDRENGVLNPRGANCLRNFPVFGPVSWGARTLRGDDQMTDEWKYIPVRRLALFIEESLFRGTKWVVFEPNDEPLWAQIRLNLGAFMHGLFRQGAFQGMTPRDAYFVKCDKETTTQDDINRGIVNIVVGFAPLKPAEFVVIKLQQMAGQIQT